MVIKMLPFKNIKFQQFKDFAVHSGLNFGRTLIYNGFYHISCNTRIILNGNQKGKNEKMHVQIQNLNSIMFTGSSI